MSPRTNALAVIAATPFVWLFSLGILCYDGIRFAIGTVLIVPLMTLNFITHLIPQFETVVTGKKTNRCSGVISFLQKCTERANQLRETYRRTDCEIKRP